MGRTFKRPLREWMAGGTSEEDQSFAQSGFAPSAGAGGTTTEVKVGGFTVIGDWRNVNEFMNDVELYLKMVGQKHGVRIVR